MLNKAFSSPLVFSITGGMGRECSMFVERLCQMISLKQNVELSVVLERMGLDVN